MAPSITFVSALLRLTNAQSDEASLLQMPVVQKTVETSDCACPGYFEEQCKANAFQGCIWTDAGDSNEEWCQCDPAFEGTPPLFTTDSPVDPNAQAPAAICPTGWEQRGEIGADIGGCGLQSCGERYDITSEAACGERCDGNAACVGFSYAPMNGDRNHPGVTACTIYNSDAPTGTWTGTQGIPTQVFCARAPTCPSVEVLAIDHAHGPDSIGKYFHFDLASAEEALGRPLVNNEVLLVWSEHFGEWREVKVWTNANGGSAGNAHGRLNSGAAAGQWQLGEHIIFPSASSVPSPTFQVSSIDHAFGPGVIGKYFNFNKADAAQSLGREIGDNEVLWLVSARKGPEKVIVWPSPNGGSTGDAHGRLDSGAAAGDWQVGDVLAFVRPSEMQC